MTSHVRQHRQASKLWLLRAEQANTHAAALMVAKTRKADADKQFYRLRDMIVDAHQVSAMMSKMSSSHRVAALH